jgi:hypothetical protein
MIFVSAIFARATLTAKMALTAKMRELHFNTAKMAANA